MKETKYKSGDKFNYWTLISYSKEDKKWLAKCICGKEKLVYVDHLKNGKSKSCSCMTKHTHNMKGTRTYSIWSHLKQRCNNPNNDRLDKVSYIEGKD